MSSRWFHSNCTADQAEHRLLTEGVDGSFLVRPSGSKVGNFTISVRYKREVNHIKIINDGDSFCLSGSPDPFATLQSLVQNYMDNPKSIKEKSGGFIELLYPIRSNDPTTERWFHGRLGSKDAERILLAKGRQGSFLVRESHTQPGQYVLAVKCKSTVHQIIIKQKNGVFEIAGCPFQKSSLHELIDYLVKNPMLRDIKDQSPINLTQPYHSTSFVGSTIKDRIEVLEKIGNHGISGFREEFEQLVHFDQNDGVYSMKVGSMEENKPKNRYKNILPYDHSRYILPVDPKEPEQRDYINANYVNPEMISLKSKYIATQGPLESTNQDFWNMVYQENSTLILMLTNEMEQSKVKCSKYWPDYGESRKFNKLIIENQLENSTTNFTRRELKVSHIEKGKKPPFMVYQYHFTEWPDHGVPTDPSAILGLLSEIHIKKSITTKSDPPIIVHCSAGIGRTGTVMAVDILMHLLDEQGFDGEIDIQKTCQILRTQRSGMIQTELQYKYIYQSIENYIDAEIKRHAAQVQETSGSPKTVAPYGNMEFPYNKSTQEGGSSLPEIQVHKAVPIPPNGATLRTQSAVGGIERPEHGAIKGKPPIHTESSPGKQRKEIHNKTKSLQTESPGKKHKEVDYNKSKSLRMDSPSKQRKEKEKKKNKLPATAPDHTESTVKEHKDTENRSNPLPAGETHPVESSGKQHKEVERDRSNSAVGGSVRQSPGLERKENENNIFSKRRQTAPNIKTKKSWNPLKGKLS